MYSALKSVLFNFDPETAHKIGYFGMKMWDMLPGVGSLVAKNFTYSDVILEQNLFGLKFRNPIGIAGGFDKDATMILPLFELGFGHLEYGTVTPKPQPGNPKPRIFRLIEDKSIQNSMGFNSKGMNVVLNNVQKVYPFRIPLIANIGKNKVTPNDEALKDYEVLIENFNEYCDLFAINISSPNTPNLRDLQNENFIKELFCMAKEKTKKPIFIKIAPDMDIKDAINLCVSSVQNGANGIIINNTSVDYSLSPNIKQQKGGISGQLITEKSRNFFAQIAKEIYGKTTLISCGGIDSAKEAYKRIRLGANFIQIFTAFIYVGPILCKKINSELAELLRKDGFKNISEAVGADLK